MTDVPTQAPTDSAVEPAGVLGYVYSRANGGIFWSLRDPRPIPNTEYMAVKWCVPVVSQGELLAARQQLAEMRGALQDALTNTPSHYRESESGRKTLAALASPSQPSRGKCDDVQLITRIAFPESNAVPDCAQPEPSPALREAAPDIAHLLKFYNVSTVEEVARIQSQRIDRLIAKLPPAPDTHPRNYREG